jgi:hypothetical protein
VLITSTEHPHGQIAVGVRRLRDRVPLWACLAHGERGLSLALIAAVQWCALHGHTIVTPDEQGLETTATRSVA